MYNTTPRTKKKTTVDSIKEIATNVYSLVIVSAKEITRHKSTFQKTHPLYKYDKQGL